MVIYRSDSVDVDVVSGRLRAGCWVFEHEENGRFNVIYIKYVLLLYQTLLVRLISPVFHGWNVVYISPSVWYVS